MSLKPNGTAAKVGTPNLHKWQDVLGLPRHVRVRHFYAQVDTRGDFLGDARRQWLHFANIMDEFWNENEEVCFGEDRNWLIGHHYRERPWNTKSRTMVEWERRTRVLSRQMGRSARNP